MKTQAQLIISKTQIVSYLTTATKISDLLSDVSDRSKVTKLKVMHSSKDKKNNSNGLSSTSGIQTLPKLQLVNLKCNALTEIGSISLLQNLVQLDISSNCIVSLSGIEKCGSLEKLIASNNSIANLKGLTEMSAMTGLTYLDLSNNRISNERQLSIFSKFQALTEIYFEKKSATNPMCVKGRENYQQAIRTHILCQCRNIKTIDGKTPKQIMKQNISQNQSQSEQPSHEQEPSYVERQTPEHHYTHAKKLTGRNHGHSQLESVIEHKNAMIQELTARLNRVEMNKEEQLKELFKKENEVERVYGQLSELNRQLDSKESKINELQRRCDRLIEACTEANKTIEQKNSQIQKFSNQMCELKIENAQRKALVKDYEKRLSQFHTKTLVNVEERAVQSQELKRQNRQLYEKNMQLSNDVNNLKERTRELTQLLREWQYKYEGKVSEMERSFEDERNMIVDDCEKRLQLARDEYEVQLRKIDEDMKGKLGQMEEDYEKALTEALGKYKSMKAQLEDKGNQERDMKNTIRDLVSENKEGENMIHEREVALRSLRAEYEKQIREKDRLAKEVHILRVTKEDSNRKLHEQLASLGYEKNSLEKSIFDLRETNNSLQIEVNRLTVVEKEYEELKEREQDMNVNIQNYKVIIDDKDNTIEGLQDSIEDLKREAEYGNSELKKKYENLKAKYDGLKEKYAEMEAHVNEILDQNKQLKDREDENILREEELERITEQFDKLQRIIDEQGKEIEAKEKREEELVSLLQVVKQQELVRKFEHEQLNREIERLQIQARESEKRRECEVRRMESRHDEEIRELRHEAEKNKRAMREKLERLTSQF